jgi:hypothetical protein
VHVASARMADMHFCLRASEEAWRSIIAAGSIPRSHSPWSAGLRSILKGRSGLVEAPGRRFAIQCLGRVVEYQTVGTFIAGAKIVNNARSFRSRAE